MIYLLYALLIFAGYIILSLLITPQIDTGIKFTRMLGLSEIQLKKIYKDIKTEKPKKFSYKLNSNNDIFEAKTKLTIGGNCEIYFETVNGIIISILVISQFSDKRWFDKIKNSYLVARKENYKIISFPDCKEIFTIFPKKYRSNLLKKIFETNDFDLGLTIDDKFFMYFS